MMGGPTQLERLLAGSGFRVLESQAETLAERLFDSARLVYLNRVTK